jgi:hypothetical protein
LIIHQVYLKTAQPDYADTDGVKLNLTFTFAGDEAGDASLNFGKGASRYLVITLVATKDADGLRSTRLNYANRKVWQIILNSALMTWLPPKFWERL